MKTAAIIVAAGKGTRMNTDLPKQYLPLLGQPVLCHSIHAFLEAGADRVILVVAPGDEAHCREVYLAPYLSEEEMQAVSLVGGGKERHDSVYQGLLEAAGADYVWIHDGARPMIDRKTILDTLEAAVACGACVAAMPVKDTIKVSHDGQFVAETPDRSKLWTIQTPQTFSYKKILEAHELRRSLAEVPANITDDGMLVEQLLKEPVKLVPGSYRNLKITTEEDMILSEALLKAAKVR